MTGSSGFSKKMHRDSQSYHKLSKYICISLYIYAYIIWKISVCFAQATFVLIFHHIFNFLRRASRAGLETLEDRTLDAPALAEH